MDKADHEHVYRCQDCGEQFEDSTYRTVILDAEKQRWIGEVRSRLPEGSRGGHQSAEDKGFDRALDAVSKVLDGLK